VQLPELIEPFIHRLEQVGRPSRVTGITAGSLYGEPRMTHDVDHVIDLKVKDVPAFIAALLNPVHARAPGASVLPERHSGTPRTAI